LLFDLCEFYKLGTYTPKVKYDYQIKFEILLVIRHDYSLISIHLQILRLCFISLMCI